MKKNDRFVACDTFCDSFMRPRPRIVLRNRIVVKTEKVINYEPFFARSVFFGVFVDSFQIYNKNPAIKTGFDNFSKLFQCLEQFEFIICSGTECNI